MKTLLSYGAGKDSTALIAMDLERDRAAAELGISRAELDQALPRFDVALFADPGAEYDETYATLAKVAELLGDRFVQVSRPGENIEEWITRLGTVPLMPGGPHVCSMKYKADPLQAYAKKAWPGEPVTWLLGIEANEGRRVKRFTPPKGDQATYRYPLIELGMDRAAVDAMLEALGWTGIRKSSCYFCPFLSVGELRDMYHNDPAKWAKCAEHEARFAEASTVKNQAWLDAGKPLNKGGRAPIGMWRVNSYQSGARLFARKIDGRQLSVNEWAEYFRREAAGASACEAAASADCMGSPLRPTAPAGSVVVKLRDIGRPALGYGSSNRAPGEGPEDRPTGAYTQEAA